MDEEKTTATAEPEEVEPKADDKGKAEPEKSSRTVSSRLDADEYEKVITMCRESGTSVSDLIKALLSSSEARKICSAANPEDLAPQLDIIRRSMDAVVDAAGQMCALYISKTQVLSDTFEQRLDAYSKSVEQSRDAAAREAEKSLSLEEKLKTAESELTAAKAEAEDLKKTLGDARAHLASETEKAQKYEADAALLPEVQEKCGRMEQERDEAKKASDQATADAEAMREKISEMEGRLDAEKRLSESYKAQLDELKRKSEEDAVKLAEAEKAKTDISILTVQLEEQKKACQSLEADKAALQQMLTMWGETSSKKSGKKHGSQDDTQIPLGIEPEPADSSDNS